jgi:hypothetical protein
MAADFLFLLVVAATKMAWSSGGVVARVGDCSWPPPGDCEGFLTSCAFPGGAPKATLVDYACH